MSQEENDIKEKPKEKVSNRRCSWLKVRYVQSSIVFLIAIISGVVRFIMSLVILGMTEKSHDDTPFYDWDKKTQGFILGASLWGETAAQFVAGVMINKCGLKISLTVSNIVNGILMISLPAFAKYGGYAGVCFIRFLQGVFLSFIFPSIHAFIGKWAPFGERTRIGTFIYAGCFMATVYCMPVSSLILKSSLGWPWILYIFGIQSILMGIIWQIFGTNKPSEHKTISAEEKSYIETSLDITEKTIVGKIPWKSFFTSKAVYGIIFSHVGCEWSYTIMHNEMPTYFRKALGVELENAGLFSGLADFSAVIVMFITCTSADFLRNRGYLSTTVVRKIFNSIGAWGVSFLLFMLVCLPIDIHIAVPITLVVLSVALDSSCNSGFWMNHIDISPNFADILFGISSTITKVVSMSSAILTGYIVSDMSNQNLWKIVFGICASTYFVGNLMFIIFGSGEVQPWDSNKSEEETENKNKEPLLELQNINVKEQP